MLTVACVFVRGRGGYTPEYVTRLHAMASRLLPTHRFVCFTDHPREMPKGAEPIKIKAPAGMHAWWAKLQLFNRAHGLSGRIVYFDLDSILLGGLDEIVRYPAPLALIPDGAPNWRPKDARFALVKRFNSSVMVWDAGACDALFDDWTPNVAVRLWGDQDWIGERMPEAAAMPLEWFPRLRECDGRLGKAKVVLCKKPKNHIAARSHQWVAEAWQ